MPQTTENCLISTNPANGEALGFVEITPTRDIPAVVAHAHFAQVGWALQNPKDRLVSLEKAAEALLSNATTLGEMLSEETGKPRRLGLREIQTAARDSITRARHTIEAITDISYSNELADSVVHYAPLGVCAVITPYCHPVSLALWMLIPALAAGNSVVLKPSEEAPLITQHVVDILQRFLPDGVLQLVHGDAEQGKALVAANVNLVAFTGTRQAGKHVMAGAAYGIKRIILELGGKDCLIVLPDADLDAAAQFAVEHTFENSGQSCMSIERMLVHRSVAQAFQEKVQQLADEIRIGSWNDPNADIGPLINEPRRQQVIGLIQDALHKGAAALVGGVNHPEHFVRPTILLNVSDDMDIVHEEICGPVATLGQFSSIDRAIELANRSAFGLGCVIFGNPDEAQAIAQRLDVGMVGINKSIHGVGDTPWVGAKQSGFGYHGSPDGYRQFTQPKVISRHR